MDADLQEKVTFYLTGKMTGTSLQAIDDAELSPALFSGYRDLTKLRYDFPLVLIDFPSDERFAEPLSGLFDKIIEKLAHGKDAAWIKPHLLRLEEDIRTLMANGAGGRLSELWDMAATPLAASSALFADSLAKARANLKLDGAVLDCDESLSYRLLSHAWALTQNRKARKFGNEVDLLVLKLSEILRADLANSDAGKSAAKLKASFGSGPMDQFDFDLMSHFLRKSTAKVSLSKSRRQRIEKLLSVLEAQQFFPTATSHAGAPYTFAFESCAAALKAYRERLPKAIHLARAFAIAELEIKGEYNEAIHDALFDSFGEAGMDAKDLALFPDYLVHVNEHGMSASEQGKLTEILLADLPFKILVQTDDVIDASPVGKGHVAFALASRRLANMAMGMNDVFVLQSPASNLLRLEQQIQSGLDYVGPALFNVFSGASGKAGGFAPYLIAAAAMEARIFPAFVFDPSAGSNWASRFSLIDNPQPDLDWPIEDFHYEDTQSQTVSERIPFTLIDFVASDPRFARHFARVPREKWNGALAPVDEIMGQEGRANMDRIPSLLMVDAGNALQKVIVDEKLIRAARRCQSLWHSLQELGGIHNSHAELLLARERQAWQENQQQQSVAPPVEPVPASPIAEAALAAQAADEEPTRSPDEAYIETSRCSTCNECTQINNKMFAYDGNQQAYIADINAGTYAQLVEAAESCQVSVIHPGKPRNPKEAGLEELMKRAEPFM